MIPSSLARVPNLLSSQLTLGMMSRTNLQLLRVQEQLASGLAVNRVSDDAVKAATIATLLERLQRGEQVERNLTHASAQLGVLDTTLGEAHKLVLQGKTIGSEQLGSTSSAAERANQAIVVDQILNGLMGLGNTSSVAGYIFGGSQGGRAPLEMLGNGYRYVGAGAGVTTDLGAISGVPISLGSNPIAGLAGRVKGAVDLDPNITLDTRLSDLRGGRSLGITPGSVEFAVNGGPRVRVDLAGSESVRDVAAKLNAAIRQYETDNGVTVLGVGGVGVSGDGLRLDVAGASTVRFFDMGNGTAAADLGLADAATPFDFTNAAQVGRDLNAGLTWTTPISALAGLTGPLGSLRISNAGRTATVDLSGATTLQDIRNRVEEAGLGIRVEIGQDGRTINVLSEVSAGAASAMSIGEVGGGNTATLLGVRSMQASTRLADFNDGSGVKVVHGSLDPLTGLPAPQLDVDFAITLGNTGGTTIDIDLRPEDVLTVGSLIARVQSELATKLPAAGLLPTDLQVGLAPDGNGITLTQNAAFTGPIRVENRNNSPAAEQLGLTDGTYDPGSARLTGSDRAKVRPDSAFSHLVDLRDALRANDTRGIRIATEKLEGVLGALTETRGLVGSFDRRVEDALDREQDKATLDLKIRSDLQDTDYTLAATRFSLLQTQLQAGYQVAAQGSRLSLLDFLR